jgi:hypothetical protein
MAGNLGAVGFGPQLRNFPDGDSTAVRAPDGVGRLEDRGAKLRCDDHEPTDQKPEWFDFKQTPIGYRELGRKEALALLGGTALAFASLAGCYFFDKTVRPSSEVARARGPDAALPHEPILASPASENDEVGFRLGEKPRDPKPGSGR